MKSQTSPDETALGSRSTSVKGSKLRMTLSRRDSDSFVAYYLCALQKRRLIYQGKLELYTDRLVFTSPVFGGISELYHSSEIVSIQKKGINALLITLDNPDMKEASLISFANRPRAMQRIRGVLGYFPQDVLPKDGNPGAARYDDLNQSEMPASESAQPSLAQGSASANHSGARVTEPETLDELLHADLPNPASVEGANASYASVISDGDVLEVAQAEAQQAGVDGTPTSDFAPPSTSNVAAVVPPLSTVADTRQTPKASEPCEDPGQDVFEEIDEVIEYEVVGDATSLHVILEDIGRAILHCPLAVVRDRLLDASTTVNGKRQWNRQFEFNGQQYDAMVEESMEVTADGSFTMRGIGGVDQLPGGVIVIEEQLSARDEKTSELVSRGTVDMGDEYNNAFSKPAMIALLADRFRVRLNGNADLEPEILFAATVDNYDEPKEPLDASVLRTMSTEREDDLARFKSLADSELDTPDLDRGEQLETHEFSSPHTLEPESFSSVAPPPEKEEIERATKPGKESTKMSFIGFLTSPISVYIIASIMFVFLVVLFFVLVRLSLLLSTQKQLLNRAARKFTRPR